MGGVAAAAGIFSFGAGLWGANRQSKADKERVELGYQDNLEKIRRRGFTQEQIKGETKARIENAGVLNTGGSTAQAYLDVMTSEFKKELDWMKRYADRSRTLGRRSVDINRQTGAVSAFSSGLSTGASVYGMG